MIIVDFVCFSGLSFRDFRGIYSIQEVECWGGFLPAEVSVFSLRLFKGDDNKELAYVNPYTGECVTFHEFSSCRVDSSNTRNSRVRTLVADLEDGHSTVLGCNVTYFKSRENTQTVTWKVQVTVKRKQAESGHLLIFM